MNNVIVEVDSQVVFWALRRPKDDMSYFGGIIVDVLALCNNFDYCSFSWVRRCANKVAHELTQFAYSCESSYCSPSIPDVILYAVEANLSAN